MSGDPTATTPPHGHVPIGRLGRAFQLEGGIRFVFTGSYGPAALDTVGRVFVVGFGSAVVRRVRRHADGIVLYLEGVRDRETATALTGAEVFAAAASLPAAGGAGAGEVLVPLAAPYVTVRAGRVELVDPPEGLLEPA